MKKNQLKEKILVVEDEPALLKSIKKNLTLKGYRVYTAEDTTQAAKTLDNSSIDLVITDMKMPNSNGMEIVKHVKENLKNTGIIVITGYPSIEDAVEAVKIGAEEYITKPFKYNELFEAVERSLYKIKTIKTLQINEREISSSSFKRLIGESKVMRHVKKEIIKAASTNATVLITGESGTGKELIAQAIHKNSERKKGPFIPVNCGAIPHELLESELFGHIKGAFTGANEIRQGFFQAAEGGTIFLDEISSTSLAMQSKLLRVLQEKEIYMVGSRIPTNINVKVLAATNKELLNLVNSSLFREDLYFRLNVIKIDLPPLKKRETDIFLLINNFLKKFAKESGKKIPIISEKALALLKQYDWPGNVRELENVIQRLVIMSEHRNIDVPDLPSYMRYSSFKEINSEINYKWDGDINELEKIINILLEMSEDNKLNSPEIIIPLIKLLNKLKQSLKKSLNEIENEHIQKVLNYTNSNKTQAAKILGINRKTLREKIKKNIT